MKDCSDRDRIIVRDIRYNFINESVNTSLSVPNLRDFCHTLVNQIFQLLSTVLRVFVFVEIQLKLGNFIEGVSKGVSKIKRTPIRCP